ncbi:MAG: phosphotransferase [Xanthomonadaceae bacterium]|nr:phosphotransferase [Xanthomonadaceae bacterium]
MNDPTHTVHDLAGGETAADWPAITASEAGHLLRGYPSLGSAARPLWHSPRPLSAAALVGTTAATVFIKRHHRSVRTAATLGEEHRFIAHLRQRGVPIPAVLADADGRTAVALDEWVYEVHQRATGIDIYRDTISWQPLLNRRHAHRAGGMLATLHQAAEGYVAPQRDSHILVARSELIAAADPIAELQAQLPRRPGLADYLRNRDWRAELGDVLAPWHAALQPGLARQPRLWTHGDWHVSNLCWSGAGDDAHVGAVLDFGLAAANTALFDLATAIERNAIAWLALDTGAAAVHPDIACALIDGYREVRPLDRDELRLLADLLPLVHVDFALSEVEYFHAVTHSTANADVAYQTFLRGHAGWFRGATGQSLLRTIRELA